MKRMMKKMTAIFVVMVLLCLYTTLAVRADGGLITSAQNPAYEYEILGDSTIAIYYYGPTLGGIRDETIESGVAVIPSSLDGYTVSRIGVLVSSNVESIVVPGSVKTIDLRAFECCDALKSLFLSEGLEIVSAYSTCSLHLKEVFIPSSVTEIGRYAFGTAPQTGDYLIPGDFDIVTDFVYYSYNNPAAVAAAEYGGFRHVDLGQFCKGDFDRNGNVDMLDAFSIFRVASGETIGNPVGNIIADMDANGMSDMIDVMTVYSTASGMQVS